MSGDGRRTPPTNFTDLMIFASPVVAFLATAGIVMAAVYFGRGRPGLGGEVVTVAFCLNALLAGAGSGYGGWCVPTEFANRVVAAIATGVLGLLGYFALCCCGGALFGPFL